ncbi:DNA sulfur modification protein DndB [Paenibacillus sp. DP01]|uniref:DNA sulfur modification protein DndB n=1 Tax=Paenibacillus sp. DP01 TaxID=3373096 RepID=UPI00384EAD75
MARLYPSLKGKLGNTEYYLTVMKAADVIRDIRSADELAEWKDFTIEERLQREINWGRIKSELAPYLIEEEDRFFGSLIVDIYNDQGVEFEPLSATFKTNNKFYESAAQAFGFLVMSGGESLFALDGQHRLKALQVAITGKGKDGEFIDDLSHNPDLGQEDITVIFIRHEGNSQKIRKIFNKINKNAKPTSKGDNIITSEDDPFALISRKLIGPDAPLKEAQVNWRSNTLSKTSKQFTTIGTLYESAEILLRKKNLVKNQLPKDLSRYYNHVKSVWEQLVKEFEPFTEMIHSTEIGKFREQLLIGKPVGQMALVEAIQICFEHEYEDLSQIIASLNKVNWQADSNVWLHVMYEPSGRIKANSTSRKLAARVIAYMIGVNYSDDEKAQLITDFRGIKKEPNAMLPDPVE